jgi:hypothetical protein
MELSVPDIDGLIMSVKPFTSPLILPTVAVMTPFVTSIAAILFTLSSPTPKVL